MGRDGNVKEKVRFGARSNEERSDTYAAWLGKDGSFYIGPRESKGAIKVSLHTDGGWFFGFTKEFVAAHGSDIFPFEHSRLDKFFPKPTPSGVTRVVTVKIPAAAVNRIDRAPKESEVIWLPAPRPGHAREIACFLTTQIKEVRAGNIVGRLKNHLGETLWIAHREVLFPNPARLTGTPARPNGTSLTSAETAAALRQMRGLAIAIRVEDGSCILEELPLHLEPR